MRIVASNINFIGHHGLMHRQFKIFISELDAEYGDILYQEEVRWLSRSKLHKKSVCKLFY